MQRRNFVKSTSAAALLATGSMFSNLTAKNNSTMNSTVLNPYHYTKSLESTRQMPGFSLNFIVTKEQTNGAYSIIEGRARKGGEPPLHVHEHEDEAFFMLDGEMMVTIGEEEYHVKKGDYIFLPRQIPHTQRFLTDEVHVLLYISPAGLEEYFRIASQPATSFEIPPLPTEPPTEEMMKMMMELSAKFGIKNV